MQQCQSCQNHFISKNVFLNHLCSETQPTVDVKQIKEEEIDFCQVTTNVDALITDISQIVSSDELNASSTHSSTETEGTNPAKPVEQDPKQADLKDLNSSKEQELPDQHESLKRYSQKDHKCEDCDQAYYYPHELNLHRRAIHLNKPLFKCHYCDRKFSHRSSRSHHVLRQHAVMKLANLKQDVKKKELVEHIPEKEEINMGPKRTNKKNPGSQHQAGVDRVKPEQDPQAASQDMQYPGTTEPNSDQGKLNQMNKEQAAQERGDHNLTKTEHADPDKGLDVKWHHSRNKRAPVEMDQLEFLQQLSQRGHGCEDCNLFFYYPRDLVGHRSKVHTKKRLYKCNYCPRKFSYDASRAQHTRRHHSALKSVLCKICNLLLNDVDRLQDHVMQKHRNETDDNLKWLKECGIENFAPKMFSCELCQKLFSCRRYVKEHVENVHLKRKSFACTFCDSDFKRKEHLKRHLARKHSILASVLIKEERDDSMGFESNSFEV